MTEFYQSPASLPAVNRQRVQLVFNGSDVTSDAGAQLLRLTDRRTGLTRALARALPDERLPGRCRHDLKTLLRQRIYGLAMGYEDLNDSQSLRHDAAFQAAVEKLAPLASASTLCRLEQRTDRRTAIAMHEILVDQFIAAYEKPPKRLILDVDATDNPVHGNQEGRHFLRHYDQHCFLPLYVFCGRHLLVSYLRSADRHAGHHAAAVIRLLVARLRGQWPRTQIVVRADAGFCMPRLLAWCDRHGVDYVIGMAKNSRLLAASERLRDCAARLQALTGKPQCLFSEFYYQAHSWPRRRRMIIKAEHNQRGGNPRFVVTSLPHEARHLYRRLYCARGEMENRIKEQMQLFSTRTSCHRWWPNQFRLLLSGFAYLLIEQLRRLALSGTSMAKAYVGTIRLKLLKVGAVIIRKASRITFRLSHRYPYRPVFERAIHRLLSG